MQTFRFDVQKVRLSSSLSIPLFDSPDFDTMKDRIREGSLNDNRKSWLLI